MKLKFRAWHKSKEIMSEVNRIDFWSEEIETIDFDESHLEDVNLMQATGIKDKNGVEIFEGDIVKRYKNPILKAEQEYEIETVMQRDASFVLVQEVGENVKTMSFGTQFSRSDLLEVIGNIYETPELLRKIKGENKMGKLMVRGISTHEKSKGEWKRGYLIEDEGMSYIINGVVEANGEHITIGEWCSVDSETLGISTGLLDKNGTEIFEGDIVKRYRSPFFKAEWEYLIETVVREKASLLLGRDFGKNFGTLPFDSPFAKENLLEVIGNVHENPELLKE